MTGSKKKRLLVDYDFYQKVVDLAPRDPLSHD